jgi:hypothetical protein
MASPGNHTLTVSAEGIETLKMTVFGTGDDMALGDLSAESSGDNLIVLLSVLVIVVTLVAGLVHGRRVKK